MPRAALALFARRVIEAAFGCLRRSFSDGSLFAYNLFAHHSTSPPPDLSCCRKRNNHLRLYTALAIHSNVQKLHITPGDLLRHYIQCRRTAIKAKQTAAAIRSSMIIKTNFQSTALSRCR